MVYFGISFFQMNKKFAGVIVLLLLALIFESSCGTTTYRRKRYASPKYINAKKHWFSWHEHHYRPHQHRGGYW